MKYSPHEERIRSELKKAGVTAYGLLKSESRYLPRLIHEDETIKGVVYGRVEAGSAMLIATDKRILFIDRKPLFAISDELTYEVVIGIGCDTQAAFAHITLHTRLGDYQVRYVNKKAAKIFTAYIEQARIEGAPRHSGNGSSRLDPKDSTSARHGMQPAALSAEALAFLQQHDLGVLSSISRTNQLNGAAVYYTVSDKGMLHILTKSETQKSHNILAHPEVAFTVYDEPARATVQLQGVAEIEPDQAIRQRVYHTIRQERPYRDGTHVPPVVTLIDGSFRVFRITPTTVKYTDFKH